MDIKSALNQLEDIQETLKYEMPDHWDSVPKGMQLDVKEALDNLRTAVYAAYGYAIIHPNK